jgi:hypothetical protein
METCKRCAKGYCPNRVKKVFGKVAVGYCSPPCASLDELSKEFHSHSHKMVADLIVTELFLAGFISDDVMGDVNKTAKAVEVIAETLKKGDYRA